MKVLSHKTIYHGYSDVEKNGDTELLNLLIDLFNNTGVDPYKIYVFKTGEIYLFVERRFFKTATKYYENRKKVLVCTPA